MRHLVDYESAQPLRPAGESRPIRLSARLGLLPGFSDTSGARHPQMTGPTELCRVSACALTVGHHAVQEMPSSEPKTSKEPTTLPRKPSSSSTIGQPSTVTEVSNEYSLLAAVLGPW